MQSACLAISVREWLDSKKGRRKKMKRMKIIATCKRMKIIATCHLSVTLFYLGKKYGGFLNDSSPCQL